MAAAECVMTREDILEFKGPFYGLTGGCPECASNTLIWEEQKRQRLWCYTCEKVIFASREAHDAYVERRDRERDEREAMWARYCERLVMSNAPLERVPDWLVGRWFRDGVNAWRVESSGAFEEASGSAGCQGSSVHETKGRVLVYPIRKAPWNEVPVELRMTHYVVLHVKKKVWSGEMGMHDSWNDAEEVDTYEMYAVAAPQGFPLYDVHGQAFPRYSENWKSGW